MILKNEEERMKNEYSIWTYGRWTYGRWTWSTRTDSRQGQMIDKGRCSMDICGRWTYVVDGHMWSMDIWSMDMWSMDICGRWTYGRWTYGRWTYGRPGQMVDEHMVDQDRWSLDIWSIDTTWSICLYCRCQTAQINDYKTIFLVILTRCAWARRKQ